MKFEKLKKKFALNNSYFKNIRWVENAPQTPFEVYEYYKEHSELPYNAEPKEDWFYKCFVEYQKRAGVDQCSYTLLVEFGNILVMKENEYVPDFLYPKEDGFGDYIIMDIDGNGQIADWYFNPETFV